MAQKPQQLLKELGLKLDNLPTSKDSLIKLLKQAASALSECDQSPSKSVLASMQPIQNSIVKPELLKHQDREVKLLVATCICEITRITAPEAPYSDDVLEDIFHLIVSTFDGLGDTSGPSFGRRVVILETLARYRSCVVMLDLGCDDLVNEMFRTFLAVVSDGHPESVLNSMQTIMVVLLEESEDIQEDLLLLLLSVLGQNKKDITMAARRLAMNVIEQCAGKLEPGIRQFLISSMSGDNMPLHCQIDYHDVIYDIYRCAPQVLSGVVPYLTGELLTDKIDIRLKAVELVGGLFALPESTISETFRPIFLEFLKRLTDRVVEVRMAVLQHVKTCLLSNPSRTEAPQIISSLCDRLLDFDENVRKQVAAVVSDVACVSLASMPVETVKLVAERLRDKSLLVKKYTIERLVEIYRNYCLKCSDGSIKSHEYDWIPGKILRCFFDKDFRSDTIEPILASSLFPKEFSVKDKVRNWVRVLSGFDKVEVKALEKILEQKQRLQQEMHKYLSLRQMYQENDAPELQKKVMFCFRVMSRCFMDPGKAEEQFLILDQLKDANIWKILTSLLDPNTSYLQACHSRDDLLRILGDKHRLYEFLSLLSLKCSYLLFSKEHVKEILLEVEIQKAAGSAQLTLSCMNILVVLACSSPLLLSGIEEDLVHLLEDEDEIIKEGVLHVLAKAGGTIRDQLGVSSSSLDLMLEKICLEGSRRQAKYAVHALAAITKDDGLMSLSVLYKRLVDMLEEKKHLPAVLQSLGCIAQTAMPVFETRENEIGGFIKREILECSQKAEDKAKECWDERSELCSLKIFGIKTFVKSYLPVKDAHLRLGIDDLIRTLKNILSFGEIADDIESSLVDKAHLKLAVSKSVLRLSKYWDHKIPIDLFYLTLRTLEVGFPQVKKLFLDKVYQYIKDRILDPKYACAFLLDLESQQPNFEEVKHNLCDIIQMCQQGKARQLSIQSDAASSGVYPEYIVPYVVHALAHHYSCPNVDECKDVRAFEPIYRRLYLFLSMLVHGDEDGKSEDSLKKDKESILIVNSIFLSIKHSEDSVDRTKTTNSHAICDLGLSIIKRLAPNQDNLQEVNASASLPPVLYKPHETNEVDEPLVSEGKTWLADESVLAHFESLKLEANGTVHSEIAEDDILKDSETDGNEVPLGKMIKLLRAKGMKARKVVKNEVSTPGVNKESDVDILKMVREINLNNTGISSKIEPSNGHEHVLIKAKNDKMHQKRRRMTTESTTVPVLKRRMSSSAQGHKFSFPRGASKGSMKPSSDDYSQEGESSFESTEMDEEVHIGSKEKTTLPENTTKVAESDLLVSCIRKGSSSSSKRKGILDDYNEVCEVEESSDHDLEKPKKIRERDSIFASSSLKSGSFKKRKRRSIAGLAKCTLKEDGSPTTDLIDCRIKVWWPMDKQFYEGVVKSYDHQKKKYVVLYDDGDVEVLRLDKERWELVDNGQKAVKRLKLSKSMPPKGLSHEQRRKSLDVSSQINESIKISPSSKVRGKRTPRKNLKHTQKKVSKSKASIEFCEDDNKPRLGIFDLEPATTSQVQDSEKEKEPRDRVEESSGDEDLDKLDKSVSEGRQMKDAESSSNDTEELKEEDPGSGEKDSNDGGGTSHADKVSNEEEASHSEEKQEPDESREESSEVAGVVGKSDSRENQTDDANSHLTAPHESEKITSAASDSGEAEISDDEPLSVWKHRAGKLVEGK